MERISWHKTDESDEFGCCPNHAGRKIYYARTYTVGKDYRHSDTNQFIHNLRKSPIRPAGELKYKIEAIQKFADEAKLLFGISKAQIDLVPMPPSKLQSDPEYDDRILKVAEKIESLCPNVKCLPLLRGTSNREAAHIGTATRNVQQLYDAIEIDEAFTAQHRPDARIVVLDDVATSGASFMAALRRIEERFPNAKTAVVIWAKAKPLPRTKMILCPYHQKSMVTEGYRASGIRGWPFSFSRWFRKGKGPPDKAHGALQSATIQGK